MIKKALILFFGVFLLMTTWVQAESFEESDVLGDWHVYAMDVDPTLGPYWFYANLSITGPTDVSGNIAAADGSTMEITNGVASIASDGHLSGSFTTGAGLTGTVINGLQDQLHTIFSYVSVDTQNVLGFAIGVKAGKGYKTADMAGEWRYYGIEIDPNLPGLYWITGDGEVDKDGIITSGTYSGADGTKIDLTGGQFSLSANGKVNATFEFDGGITSQVADGMVDIQKTFAVFVTTNSAGGLGFDLALKKGGTYQPSDLEGNWTFYNFTIDAINELVYWVYGTGTVDEGGNLTGSYTGPDSSVFNMSNGKASLSATGEITGSFTIDGVGNETIQSGFMDQNKSIIVFVGTSDTGQMDLGIGLRTSDLPASQSKDDGGGDGGSDSVCFISSMIH